MKLIIKTKDIELEYVDEYSNLLNEVKDRIKEILVTVSECNALIKPTIVTNTPALKK